VTEADRIIARLGLQPHPEGGWYRQTWVAAAAPGAGPGGEWPSGERPSGERPLGTCIQFLLKAGERSHWHRIDADELWLYHAGAPIELRIAKDAAGPAVAHRLGPDVLADEACQVVVPAGHWQAARSLGDWTLVGCVVSPGFRFEGFELAPAEFDIPGDGSVTSRDGRPLKP
jgi:predicted cupin superfamily sugar epimerase